MATDEPVALFLFAHQDDEFGAFQQIADERQAGRRVCCAYLTTGVAAGGSPRRRNHESLSVLKQLGVGEPDVSFAGHALSIPDAGLPRNLARAADWIDEKLSQCSMLASVYVPAWEGGHHDHDALHAITVSVAQEKGMLLSVRQFPLYNGHRCRGPLFRVFAALPCNGTVERTRIRWGNRIRFLRYCLCYPSQAKTWAGLFPFVLLHYLTRGDQLLQPVCVERIGQRPHAGPLYYERRRFFTWERMASCLWDWRRMRLLQPDKLPRSDDRGF
jgi:LmbE family N-acetylglucosaminyl deacetylase